MRKEMKSRIDEVDDEVEEVEQPDTEEVKSGLMVRRN